LRLLLDETGALLQKPRRNPVVVGNEDDVIAFRIRKTGVPVRKQADIRS